jgi:hypothetical protein
MPDTSSRTVLERSLAFKMLGPIYSDFLRVLVREAGPDLASQAMTPHAYHGAVAGALILRQMGLVEGDGPLFCLGVCQMFLHMDGTVIDKVGSRGSAFAMRVSHCSMCRDHGPLSPGEAEVFCLEYEWGLCGSVWREFAPGMELTIVRSLARGDKDCFIVAHKLGEPVPDESEDWVRIPNHRYDEALVDYLPAAYLIEAYVYTVRCLLETIGEERSWDLLRPIMRSRGEEMGRYLSGRGARDTLRDLLQALCITFREEGRQTESSDMVIDSCLLTAAPPICCRLLDEYLNAALLVEGKGMRVEHRSCIPCGDEICKMIVTYSSKGPNNEYEVLRMRLARGEITIEEYEKVKRALED